MIIKLNTTGTHIHKGLLKLRADLYPSVTDKTYALQHVYVPVIPEGATDGQIEDKAWVDALPHTWQLNPALCHFFAVPENFKLEDVEDYLRNLFAPDTWATLDNYLVVPNSIHYISPYMKGKQPLTKSKVKTQDLADLIASANVKLSGQSDIELAGGGNIEPIIPESIDVGPGATLRSSTVGAPRTLVEKENPANADGSIDTVELYFSNNAENIEAATFYVVSGNNLSTRDDEYIGSVPGGSKQVISGLDIDIVTGDYIGIYKPAGYNLYRDTSGGSGTWYTTSDDIPCTDLSFYTYSGYVHSIYATGTEGGGPTEKTSSDSGSGLDANIPGSPAVTAVGTELAEGASTASLTGVIASTGDSGSGVESSFLETGGAVNKFSTDTSVGTDIAETVVVWIVSDSGIGTEESIVSPVFFAADSGIGLESGVLIKNAYGSDAGNGEDVLKTLVGAGGKSADMRLFGGSGKAKIPSRQARIPSKGVNI